MTAWYEPSELKYFGSRIFNSQWFSLLKEINWYNFWYISLNVHDTNADKERQGKMEYYIFLGWGAVHRFYFPIAFKQKYMFETFNKEKHEV